MRDTEQMLAQKSNSGKLAPQKPKSSYKIKKEKIEIILEKIPFESAVKNNKVEIVLQNDEEVERFISFCNQIH